MFRFAAYVIAAVLLAGTSRAADPAPLFSSNETLEVRISAPFDAITRDRSEEEDVAGTFELIHADGSVETFDVGVRPRGRYRGNPEVCRFPPLRLNYKKSQLEGTLLDGQNKLKLVTHCEPGSYRYKQTVLSEYTAYRILNVLTDASFAVRLFEVTYLDSEDGKELESTYAFVIEDEGRVAKRLETEVMETNRVEVAELNAAHLNLTSVFHYMIGNTDFSATSSSADRECCHNHALFGATGGPYLSIPYDFDMAGLVDAPHAAPNPKLRLQSVQERLYRGRCVNNALLPSTLEYFAAKRDRIEAVVAGIAELNDGQRAEILKYIRSFYASVSTEKKIDRNMIRKCR